MARRVATAPGLNSAEQEFAVLWNVHTRQHPIHADSQVRSASSLANVGTLRYRNLCATSFMCCLELRLSECQLGFSRLWSWTMGGICMDHSTVVKYGVNDGFAPPKLSTKLTDYAAFTATFNC